MSTPAQKNFWFDREGLDGTRDTAGGIEAVPISGVDSYHIKTGAAPL